jgi:hypothetical protein
MNHEYIDRIILAVESQIEGKTQVDVKVVETLLYALRDLNNRYMNKIYHSEPFDDTQMNLMYYNE